MTITLSQDDRAGKLTTPLGPDELVLLRINGTEYVNELFEYTVEALALKHDIDFNSLIGESATVSIESPNSGTRHYNGVITQARWVGPGEGGNVYSLTLRPFLWLASKQRNQRIFKAMDVAAIIGTVFANYAGMTNNNHVLRLTGNYPELEYTVQYRESDLDFVRRLMERFGISFHFIHEDGAHTLVVTDASEEHDDVADQSRPYYANPDDQHNNEESFGTFENERNLTTGSVKMTEYNFKTPTALMDNDRADPADYKHHSLEVYDYPGDYLIPAEGRDSVSRRLIQEQSSDFRAYATGDCVLLGAGMIVELGGDEIPGLTGTKYLCIAMHVSFASEGYASNAGHGDGGTTFEGRYTLTEVAAPFGPPMMTPLPVVYGPQTGTVVGEGEIDCDEFGRIWVHMPWDLDEAYTMRCRVSQNWAGKGWGGMVIPRIGMEVVVEFLEGDPDKPLVTGCVYNGKNDVPYPLPANKTRSTFKTDSHQAEGFNELRFEDAGGEEEIFIHAQKDRNEETLNDHSEEIGNDWSQWVGNDKEIEVTNDHDELIGGSMSIIVGPTGLGKLIGQGLSGLKGALDGAVKALGIPDLAGGDFMLIAEKNKTEMVGISSTTKVGIKTETTIGVSSETSVGKSTEYFVGKSAKFESGKTIEILSGEAVALDSGKEIKVAAGDNIAVSAGKNVSNTAGKSYVIDAGDELSLVCGSASIKLKKDGTIQLKGKNLDLNGSGKVNVKASSTVKIKGAKVDIN